MQETTMSRFLNDIVPIATSAVSEEEVSRRFTDSVSRNFGVESVAIIDLKHDNGSAVEGYLKNTKKPIVDNQLSDYSAFPELINYRNKGFKSYAAMPLLADGKVVSMLEMMSQSENKFSEEMMGNVMVGASFIGFVLMYKSELGRSIRLATYFDAAFNTIFPQFIVAEDGTIVKYNKAAIKQFDMAVPERRPIDKIMKMDYESIKKLTKGMLANIVIDTAAGRERVYAIAASKINEKLVHIAANDITDAFTYASLSGLLNRNRDVCVVFLGAGFGVNNISQNAEQMFVYSKTALSNSNFLNLVAESERAAFEKNLAQLKDEDVGGGSATLIFPEFGQRYVHYAVKRHNSGYVVMLVNADVEKHLISAQKDLDDFTTSTSDIVFGVDSLGYIRDCNLPAEVVLGYNREELIGKELKFLYGEQAILDRDITYVRKGGKIDNSFVTLIAKDQTQIPATHSLRLLHTASEKGVEYIVFVKELGTKRRLAEQEEEIRNQGSQLKRMRMEGDLKSQFIYNISHELKTPLTSIKGYSKLLYDGEFGPLNDDQRGYIQTTLDEADRLMLIIQQVLDAAKLEAEKIKLEPKEVDLAGMANNPSIKALEESARNKGLEFKWEVSWEVPTIMADPNRLIQIFVNLIGNAIKFTQKGGVSVKILRKNKKNVECRIIDTGIGIAEDDKKKLKFRRKFYEIKKDAELVQQPGAGTGLGLSITKDLVRLHGGKIGFESKLGSGSTFYFTLPISPKTKKKQQANSSNSDSPSSTPARAQQG